MRSVADAFLNYTSCVDFEHVKCIMYVVIECNGKLFLDPTLPWEGVLFTQCIHSTTCHRISTQDAKGGLYLKPTKL